MATIPKAKAIHSGDYLKNAIKYIQEDNKTNFKLYCDGMNVCVDDSFAVEQFELVQNLYNKNTYENTNKKKIIAHHFTQNFPKDEKISPELAMQIAMETAKKHFGDDFQILISTHIDKDFIHNHFIVNSVSLKGEKYQSKGETLSSFRKTSDDICKSYGLSTLDFSKHKYKKRTLTYNRWRDNQKGISWKDRIKLDIDSCIIKSKNIEELFEKLDKRNYECKFFYNAKGEKYFGIRDKKFKKSYFANTKNFGKGYELKSILNRIENKDLEKLPNKNSIDKVIDETKFIRIKTTKSKNIQVNYKSTINTLLYLIETKNIIRPVKYYKNYRYSIKNDYHVQTLANQLNFLRDKNITTREEFETQKIKLEAKHEDLKTKVDKLVKMKSVHKKLINEFETLSSLKNKKGLTRDEHQIMRKLELKLDEFDQNKINNNLLLIEENIQKIKPAFESYSKDFKMFEEIESTLEDIEKETYIDKAKISNNLKVDVEKEKHIENKELDRSEK